MGMKARRSKLERLVIRAQRAQRALDRAVEAAKEELDSVEYEHFRHATSSTRDIVAERLFNKETHRWHYPEDEYGSYAFRTCKHCGIDEPGLGEHCPPCPGAQ